MGYFFNISDKACLSAHPAILLWAAITFVITFGRGLLFRFPFLLEPRRESSVTVGTIQTTINRFDPTHWPGIDPEQYPNTKDTGRPRRARGAARPSGDGSTKAGPGWKTSRRREAAWLTANIADQDPSVRSKRGLRQGADPFGGILNWISNRIGIHQRRLPDDFGQRLAFLFPFSSGFPSGIIR